MKRTKHIVNILTAAVTLLLTASCNVSYPDLDLPQGEPPTNDEDVNIDKTSILLYTSNPAYFSVVSDTRGSVGTRGTGAFEPMETVAYNRDKYLNAKFHIFAFRAYNDADPNGGQGVLTEAPSMSRYCYAKRYAYDEHKVLSKDNKDENNTSCLLDGPDYEMGMPFKFEPDQFIGTMNVLTKDYPEDIYYSSRYQDVGYNFFGYFVDDLDLSNYTREKDKITYDIEIDGYQDVLVGAAKTPLTEADFAEGGIYEKAARLTEEEKQKILNTPGNYSTFAAHRNVHPVVNMKHQLTMLKFFAYPGASSAKDVVIKDISVMTLTKGTLTVASRNIDDCKLVFKPENEVDVLQKAVKLGEYQKETDESGETHNVYGKIKPGLRDEGYQVKWKDEWVDNESQVVPGVTHVPTTKEKMDEASVELGAGLLVAPQESYVVTLTYLFPDGPLDANNNYTMKEHKTVYRITPAKKEGEQASFEKGLLYNVKIGVYGLEKIQISGSVDGWGKGEDIDIDQDKNPNDPNINGY